MRTTSPVRRRGACRLGLLVLALAVLLLAPGRVSAAPLTVCPSGCTYTMIADALAAASNGDVIVIGAGTYSGGFTINKSVTLLGAGAGQTTISGGGPVVTIAPLSVNGQVTITGVTITGGVNFFNFVSIFSGKGGGIFNRGGLGTGLLLTDSAVSGNTATSGGGIDNCGFMKLKDVTVSGNTAAFSGGGITNPAGIGLFRCGGQMALKDSTVSGNTGVDGGGIFNLGGVVTLDGSTISGNTATNLGGGIYNLFTGACSGCGVVTLKDSTVSSNTASIDGGGIFNDNGGLVTLTDSTVSGNTPDDCVGC